MLSVFSQLPLLRQLRLKGATSSAVSHIVARLPLLELLDTEYIAPSHTSSTYADLHALPASLLDASTEFPRLRSLTIRTFSISSALSLRPQEEDATTEEHLWSWILSLVPTRSLRSFALNAFSTHGILWIPRSFVERMTEEAHVVTPPNDDGPSLGNNYRRECPQIGLETWEIKGGWMIVEDLELLCARAGALKAVSCAVEIADIVGFLHLLFLLNFVPLRLNIDMVRPLFTFHRPTFLRLSYQQRTYIPCTCKSDGYHPHPLALHHLLPRN